MKKKLGKIALLLMLIIIIGGIAIGLKTHFFEKMISDLLYDNRRHFLSCEELPTLSEVEQVVEEHQNLIQEIEQVHPGFIFVSIGSPCPGKGEIIFEYASHQDRLRIEELIGGDTFFGIPYRGINT
ncbi:MAG: hypothetical protein K8R40_02095 [Anaerolineaceae bacterium]|nr:hypothetical protein [Anaerolineaceae bacterium]